MSADQNIPLIDEFEERKRKLAELRELGVQPYPERFERTHTAVEARADAEQNPVRTVEEILAQPGKKINLAGRIVLMRAHGKLSFLQLQDSSGKIQIALMQDALGAEKYKLLRKIDMADFIGASGELFMTKHGELTLLVNDYVLLAKSLRPLPEKFHGLADQETKYRKRYLDTLTDPDSFQRFIFRTKLVSLMRRFLDDNGFLEVDTPILTNTASGATAKPFTTHHNALDIDMYLSIACETYLKRAVVGGYERVYNFAKCFRNEGMDPSHLQEFLMLEYYASYWNYEDNMDFTEKFLTYVLKELKGDLKVSCRDHEGKEQIVDFTAPWPRVKFSDLIKKDCGIDIMEFYGDADGLKKEIKKQKIQIEKIDALGYGNLCDQLYKKVSRPKLLGPMFVTLHPVDTKPLARRNDQDPRLADSFQLLVNSWEIVNAYSELVDPLDQRARLVAQASAKDAGDEEAMSMDEEFLLAMEHGMPPMSGWGLGIDRFVALLTNQDNLKDTVMFPLMKPDNL